MPTPQPAIFREDSRHHYFLEYSLRERGSREALIGLIGAAIQAAQPDVNLVVAFGPETWRSLSPGEQPEDFIGFHPVLGQQDRTAPGTQADVLFWIHGAQHDHNLASARAIHAVLRNAAALDLELHGFTYLDSRDMTGFIDGTENPRLAEARSVALIADGRPGAGGSFVLSQQWVHDLDRFSALEIAQQENVIGRTKPDSIELEDAPATAHVRRTDVKIDGTAMKIYRRSTPFGGVRDNGLYFLAFSCELMRFAILLDRMFGLGEDAVVDRLTEFSTPVSGSYWFAPPVEALSALFGCAPE